MFGSPLTRRPLSHDLSLCTRLFEWVDCLVKMGEGESSLSLLNETNIIVFETATRSTGLGTSLEPILEKDLKSLLLPANVSLPPGVLGTQSTQEPATILLSEICHAGTAVGVGDCISMEGERHLVTSICAIRSETNPDEIVDVVLETQPAGCFLFCLSVSSQHFSESADSKSSSEDEPSDKVESEVKQVQEQPSGGEATPLTGERTEGVALFSL